jgi:hypothetical protein
MQVSLVLCFLSRRLLIEEYGVGAARALVIVEFLILNRE